MNAPDDALGYAHALEAYRQAGWIGVLPLKRGRKIWPPSIKCAEGRKDKYNHRGDLCPDCISYTGHHGIDPSYADLMAWAEEYRDGNLALRLPNNAQIAVVGIDVDQYGAKHGAAALAEGVRRWGPLPGGPRSSSRAEHGDMVSGIRLFRVPPGTILEQGISFPELGLGDIEIIQRHHRYVLSWPSVHPEGRLYWWVNEHGQIVGVPNIDDLPWLPQTWIDGLRLTAKSPMLTSGGHYNVAEALTLGDPSPSVRERMQQAFVELNMPGTSRHDTAMRHVMALLRMGKSGEAGVAAGLQMLCEVFVAAVVGDGSRSQSQARGEFERFVTNDNAARELAQPGLLDWMKMHITAEDVLPAVPPVPQLPPAPIATPMDTGPDVPERGFNEPVPPTAPCPEPQRKITRPASPLDEIEQGFWDSRESLANVYQSSMASMSSPWGVLGVCSARALAQVRAHITLPPIIGQGAGSLNWFLALVAGSGGGKTTSMATAEYLVPGHIITCQQGTGEGILATYGRAGDPSDPKGVPEFESVMLDVDEIDALGAVSGRSGSTTMPILRSAFSGSTLGFSYAAKDKRRYIRRHTYRMTAVVGVQPRRAGWVLADTDGGTPQRFMWFPALDARVRWKDKPWATGPLQLPPPACWMYATQLTIPREAEELIGMEHEKRAQGGQDALDGHALFCREKFAFALAVLDGRTQMTSEDWELSGIAANISTYVREQVVNELKEAAHIEATDRGEIRGVENAAADAAKQFEEAERVRRALRWIMKRLDAAGSAGMTQRDLMNSADSRTMRSWVPAALTIGQTNGLIRPIEGTTTWVLVLS